jgi:1A family penicillin-binding protein
VADPSKKSGCAPSDGGLLRALAAIQIARTPYDDVAALRGRLAVPGLPLSRARGHARSGGRLLINAALSLALALLIAALLATGTILWVLHDLPLGDPPAKVRNRSIALETADGTPLGRLGPLRLADAPRAAFADILVKAVLSTEDRRFYEHRGIDLAGIFRAARRNYDAGGIVEGGSTITQQLVKARYLSNERTYDRKLREVFLALWLELKLSKDEILARYLNSIYMGGGAEGVPAAARLYFDKAPSELSLSEAALLAGLIKAPSRFNPLRDPELAYQRAAQVLDAMVDNRAIDRKTAEGAKQRPAALRESAVATPAGTWFSDWVGQEALDATGSFPGETRVRTTLVPALQSLAEEVVGNALRQNADRNVAQAALVAMRPDGAVLAMVGGRDYKQSQFNRAVQALRQPGSAFKLFVYMAALRNGAKLDDTIDASAPDEVNGWVPENYGGHAYARVTLADAFARSINTAAVRLALQVGLDNVVATARELGIEPPLPKVPSLALGSAEVNLLNLTAAYAAVLAGQAPVRPWGVTSFASPIQPRLMSIGPRGGPQHALGDLQRKLIALLRLPVERGTAREAALEGLAAGKTGTTQDNRDAWFLGFDEALVVGIWVGNDDRSPMRGVTGGSLPAPMWKEFMTKAVSRLAIAKPAPAAEENPALAIEEAPQRATCDYRACARRYRSFNADDCTYRPPGGGRRRSCEITATGPQLPAAERSQEKAGAVERSAIGPGSELRESGPLLPAGPPTRRASGTRRAPARARSAGVRPVAKEPVSQQKPGFGPAFLRQVDTLGQR